MKRIALLASLLVLIAPGHVLAATAIPVVDVLTLSSYGTEFLSGNDRVTSMAADEPRSSCYASGTKSAWYRITTNVKGQMAARLLDYTGVDSIALYQGTSFADVVELGCVSYVAPTTTMPQPYVRAGDSLYLQVIADGTYTVSALIGPTPFIDNFVDAEDLEFGYMNFQQWTTANTTVEPGEPLLCGGARTAWLRFTPAQSGPVTFMTLGDLNDVLALYRGSTLADLQLMVCGESNLYTMSGDVGPRYETRLTATLTRDVTYYVQVAATQGDGSLITTMLSSGLPVQNDSPATAIALSQNHTVNGTTVSAFTRPLVSSCPYTFGTVWYRVTPLSTGVLEVTVDSKPTEARGNFIPAVAIHRADTGELLGCQYGTTSTVMQTAPVEAGISYLINVMSAGFPGDFRMHWAVR